MVVGELAQAFEGLARGILTFVNYGITILVIMFIIEVVKFFRGELDLVDKGISKVGSKLKEPFSRTAKDYQKGGLKGAGKGIGRDAKKLWRGEEKAEKTELSKYVALKDLRKSVANLDDVKDANGLKKVIREIRSDEKIVMRDERKASRRINKLKKLVDAVKIKANKKAQAELILKKMGALNTQVLQSTVAFDNELKKDNWKNFNNKKENLKKAINLVISQESGLFAEFRKLKKLLTK